MAGVVFGVVNVAELMMIVGLWWVWLLFVVVGVAVHYSTYGKKEGEGSWDVFACSRSPKYIL